MEQFRTEHSLVGIPVRLCSIKTRGTVEVSLMFECIMVLRHYYGIYYGITVLLWYHGIMVLWYYGIDKFSNDGAE